MSDQPSNLTYHIAMNDLSTLLEHMERDDVEARRADIDALSRVITLLAARMYKLTQEDANAIAAKCETQTDTLMTIARANRGICPATMAAKAIITAGMSKSSQVALTASLWNRMGKSRHWEHVAPGEFRLVSEPRRTML